MTFRSALKQTLEPIISDNRIAALQRIEVRARRRIATALDPSLAPNPRTTEGEAVHSRQSLIVENHQRTYAKPQMARYEFIGALHRILKPRTYLEIGVNKGGSLARSRTRSIGVDPDFQISAELYCNVQLVRSTSDDFFAREDPLEHFGGTPVDLAFIDGMHLSEFAYRDFVNIEKLMDSAGVILMDDVLPRSPAEAARERVTRAWTGDVYKVVLELVNRRSDLVVVPVNTSTTGAVLVTSLDPASTVLADAYENALPALQASDPQQVPEEVLRRWIAVPAKALLKSPALARLAELRESGSERAAVVNIAAELNSP